MFLFFLLSFFFFFSLPSPPPPPPPPGESLNFKAIYTRKEEEDEEERKRRGRRLGARVELYTTLRTGGRVVAAGAGFVRFILDEEGRRKGRMPREVPVWCRRRPPFFHLDTPTPTPTPPNVWPGRKETKGYATL